MKNILVTGGTGFIGSNLTLELQSRYPGAFIVVIDDFRGSSFKNLLGFKGEVLAFDVAQRDWLKVLEDREFDAIFHLASITDTTILDEKKMIFDNVEGFRNVLELALETKADVVYASSAGAYGSQDTPMKEEDAGKPNNVYGFSKWVMDQLAESYSGKLKIVGLRYFNVFGPRESFKGSAASMIYQLAQQMLAGRRPRIFKWGDQRRDFIYAKDVVEATITAHQAKRNTVLNVGTGQATSFNEVIEALNEALGAHLEPDYFDNPYDFYQNFTQADMTRTKKEISFQAKFTTREGILDYVRNYLLPSRQAETSPTA
ncbi:MAG: ADP-glyceromanno-heptose 6-epimerase [Candidatus Omnitrophica bacterium]|nr:ADP-glyceromanno-heptose 6-epimerase [Candidatus Omnitrophota bacterium]